MLRLLWLLGTLPLLTALVSIEEKTSFHTKASVHARRSSPSSLQPELPPKSGLVRFRQGIKGEDHLGPKRESISVPLRRLTRSPEEQDRFFQTLKKHHDSLLGRSGTISKSKAHRVDDESLDAAWHGSPPSSVREYELELRDISNSQFVGTIEVGSPGQSFDVIFDTGSSNLWINGVSCTDEACLEHKRFDPKHSSSFLQLDTDMDVLFGTGSISGSLAQDDFTVGPVRVKQQTFGMIREEKGSVFLSGKFDGILGLSFPALSAASYTPVFDNIMQQSLLEKNLFSFFYATQDDEDSALVLGTPSRRFYSGEISWIEVSKPVYWEIELKDIVYGGRSLNVCPDGPCKIVVDSGTSLLTGPSQSVSTVVEAIEAVADCSDEGRGRLPVLTYVLQDKQGEHRLDLTSNYYLATDSDDKHCKAGYMALDVDEPRGPLWILGDSFMQQFFTVFSRNPPKVGFARAKHPPDDPSKESTDEQDILDRLTSLES